MSRLFGPLRQMGFVVRDIDKAMRHWVEVCGIGVAVQACRRDRRQRPFRFLEDEHISGAWALFERFAEYQPRANGVVGFTAGPKVTHFERVAWVTFDRFSASAALRRGEIDWWENPPRDLVDQVRRGPQHHGRLTFRDGQRHHDLQPALSAVR